MKLYALIVAGGQGIRMNTTIPKQFLELNGKPMLIYILEAFHLYDNNINIIMVLPENQINYWEKMIDVYGIKIKHELVIGGDNRFNSVKNGLSTIKEKGLVTIHDGVRPLITQKIIGNSYQKALESGNAITSVDLKDSIRKTLGDSNKSINRANYKLIQTPQTFDIRLIQKAYQQEDLAHFTDDASVLEQMGEKIHLIEGSYSNIKITTQEDLTIASGLLSEFSN